MPLGCGQPSLGSGGPSGSCGRALGQQRVGVRLQPPPGFASGRSSLEPALLRCPRDGLQLSEPVREE